MVQQRSHSPIIEGRYFVLGTGYFLRAYRFPHDANVLDYYRQIDSPSPGHHRLSGLVSHVLRPANFSLG